MMKTRVSACAAAAVRNNAAKAAAAITQRMEPPNFPAREGAAKPPQLRRRQCDSRVKLPLPCRAVIPMGCSVKRGRRHHRFVLVFRPIVKPAWRRPTGNSLAEKRAAAAVLGKAITKIGG